MQVMCKLATVRFIAVACAVAAAATPGCGGRRARDDGGGRAAGYDTPAGGSRGDSDAARRENARAVQLMDGGDFAEAEAVLKDALSADVMFGPAHNNLGKVYYHQGDLYRAAWEFQYAAKLMPHQPEPLNNLGLVFESAGKLDEAVESYGKAVGAEPDNAQFIGNLARARVRRGDDGEDVRELLSKLVMRETRPDWADWARRTLSRLEGAATE